MYAAYVIFQMLFFERLRFVCRRIGENLEESVPNIESVILTNNSMQELGDLDVLSTLPKLETLRYVS